jgi:hypothetical protein
MISSGGLLIGSSVSPICSPSFNFWRLELRCRFTNCCWCQLRSQRLAGALAGNQLLPNASLERDKKALIDLVDGLSSRTVVLVSVTNDNLADHDACLGSFNFRGGVSIANQMLIFIHVRGQLMNFTHYV